MALAPGARVGSYEVIAAIGAGGMGEVYRARDLKLGREVALKILPDAFANDAERLARFQREAQVLASLNHPNIGAIYGLEDSGGTRALVLELVEGPTLADRIAAGPIPLADALDIASQLAEVLEAAHERGIIHRDLKPANIKLRPDGTVKVLDFGLAKALTSDSCVADPSYSPTISLAGTLAGVILGTAAYMAPEQARGRPVDKRADVWAFGAVLYEMLAGSKAFPGEDVSDTLATVLKFEPDWSRLPADTPPAIRRLLRRCLVKDPKLRLRECGSALVEIHEARTTPEPTVPATAVPIAAASHSRSWRTITLRTVAAALFAAIGGLAVWGWLQRQALPAPSPKRFSITLPASDELTRSQGPLLAISPDGKTLVYRAFRNRVPQLYRRDLDAFDATPIAGTEQAGSPFFSSDGKWLGFVVDATLKKVRLAGGPPQSVLAVGSNIRGANWGIDDRIIFGSGSAALMQVPAGGGATTVLYQPTAGQVWYPQLLPGGKEVLFTITPAASALDNAELHVLTLATGEVKRVLQNAGAGRVLESGHLAFVRGGALWTAPFDSSRIEVRGDAMLAVEGVRIESGGAAQWTVAGDGSLAYIPGASGSSQARSLIWVTADGKETALPALPRDYQSVALSPDGAHAALQIGDGALADVWVSELARGTLTRVTNDPGFDGSPLWTPDGKSLVFASQRNNRWQIARKAADGTGSVELLATIDQAASGLRPQSWSPDGSTLLVEISSLESNTDIGTVPARGSGTYKPLISTKSQEAWPAISPDGRWLAYSSNETGEPQVYVQRYPDLGDRQVVSVGGFMFMPTWSRTGRTLYYLRGGPPNAVMRVAFEDRGMAKPIIGTPERAFDFRYFSRRGASRYFDVARDAERLLMIGRGDETAEGQGESLRQINVVLNWHEELKRLTPLP